jgi:hypothetical protein
VEEWRGWRRRPLTVEALSRIRGRIAVTLDELHLKPKERWEEEVCRTVGMREALEILEELGEEQ